MNANKVSGKFQTFKSSPFLIVKTATYSPTDVKVNIGYADAAKVGTRNTQREKAAGALTNRLMAAASESYLNENTKFDSLIDYAIGLQSNLTPMEAQKILVSNSGSIFAESPSINLKNQSILNSLIARRTSELTNSTGVWTSLTATKNHYSAKNWNNITSDLDMKTFGADKLFSSNLLVGGYITDSKESSNFEDGYTKTNSILGGIYTKYSQNQWYALTDMNIGQGDIKFNRSIYTGTDTRQSKSKTDLNTYSLYGELGYKIHTPIIDITPFAGLSYSSIKQDSIKERQVNGLSVNSISAHETAANLGFRFKHDFTNNLSLGGFTEYKYAFNNKIQAIHLVSNLTQDAQVTYNAPSLNKGDFSYGMIFNYANNNWVIFGDAGFTQNSKNREGQIGVKYLF